MLTVLTRARTMALTTYAAVKQGLLLEHDHHQEFLVHLINTASRMIATEARQTFPRQRYRETLPGTGTRQLMLKQAPLGEVEQLLHLGAAVSSWYVDNRGASILGRDLLWFLSQIGVPASLGGTPMPGGERPWYQVDYLAGRLLPTDDLASSTLSLSATDNSLNDSAGRLPLLAPDDTVELAAFGLVGNIGEATVVSRTASKLILADITLQDESAGPHLYLQATTLSIQASDQSLNDSANGLGNLLTGDTIQLGGFSNGPNTVAAAVITTVTAGKLVLALGTLVDESAGPTVTVTLLHPAPAQLLVSPFVDDCAIAVEFACIETVKAWYLQRQWDITGERIVQTDAGAFVLRSPNAALPKIAQDTLRPWKRVA